jgi:hypothetical protein
MLEHHDGVCAIRDGCAGHDLECRAGLERCGGCGFTGAQGSDDRKPIARSDCGRLHSVAVASGAVKGREVAVCVDGCCENAMESFLEREVLCAAAHRGSQTLGLCEDQSCGFRVGEHHVGIVRLEEWFRSQETGMKTWCRDIGAAGKLQGLHFVQDDRFLVREVKRRRFGARRRW